MSPSRIATAVLIAGAAALLAGCASQPVKSKKRGFSPSEYGVAASPRVVPYGQPVPRGGGREMVGQPYTVAGKVYRPKVDEDYSKVGVASWYGDDFHGRLTANGEVYDMDRLSAAHPTFPLPSYARVTNLRNGRSVVVRVNDRGPYHSDRLIDLSAKAADMLDFKGNGTANVRVEYAGKARIDGQDDKMLFASYRGPGKTMIADSRPGRRDPDPAPEVRTTRAAAAPAVAAVNAGPARTPRDLDDIIYGNTVTATPARRPNDPISGVIAGSGFRSYAAVETAHSPGQRAIDGLVKTEKAAAGSGAVVQIGAFGDRQNAERIAGKLGAFGTVTMSERTSNGRSLVVVQLVTADPEAAIAAAVAAGATGARLVR